VTFDLGESRQLLAGTPAALRGDARRAVGRVVAGGRGAGDVDAVAALAHLTHVEERDWLGARRRSWSTGPRRSSGPSTVRPGSSGSRGGTWAGCWIASPSSGPRTSRLDELHLGNVDLVRIGRHADLGPVTLEQLLATWTVHDLNHETQIAKTLAKRYREAVGPWRANLGVVDLP
jgi:hypothetical protein